MLIKSAFNISFSKSFIRTNEFIST